jgi:hypothetical protein
MVKECGPAIQTRLAATETDECTDVRNIKRKSI